MNVYGVNKNVNHQYVCLVVYGFASFWCVFLIFSILINSDIKLLMYVLFICSV